MKFSNELKKEIEDLLKNNPELRDRVLAGDAKAIQEVAIMGQKDIPPEDIIEAYENDCMEYLYK